MPVIFMGEAAKILPVMLSMISWVFPGAVFMASERANIWFFRSCMVLLLTFCLSASSR